MQEVKEAARRVGFRIEVSTSFELRKEWARGWERKLTGMTTHAE